MIALLHQGGASLPGVSADQDVVALRNFSQHRLRGGSASVFRIAADIARLLRAKNEVVIRSEWNSGFRGLRGDSGGHMEIDRLDDDRVNALRDDVFGLRDLVLRIVLRGLDEHRIARLLGRLLEERHVGMEIAEGGLLLQHEGDFVGLAGRAVRGRRRADGKTEQGGDRGGGKRCGFQIMRFHGVLQRVIVIDNFF